VLKNFIINGGFDIWQRGNGTFTTNQYSADRHYTGNGRGVVKEVDSVEGNVHKCTNDVASGVFLAQPIELKILGNNNEFKIGNTYTLTARVKSSAKVRCYAHFRVGVAGTATEVFTGDEKGGNDVYENISWTFTVTASASGSQNNLLIRLWSSTDEADFRVSHWQLEEGSVFTGFEKRPIGMELALCQRYYFRTGSGYAYSTWATGFAESTTEFECVFHLQNTLRAIPSISSSGAIRVRSGSTHAVSALNISGITITLSQVHIIATTTGLTAGQGGKLTANNNNASYVALDAEL